MEMWMDPKLLELVKSIDNDVSKVLNEALKLWLREKILTCPITKNFCNQKISCNDCNIINIK